MPVHSRYASAKHELTIVELAARSTGKLSIPELLLCLKPHKPLKQMYRAAKIAAKYGHRVLWTPPYMHPLAFCEPLWNAVKAPIARKTLGSMDELKDRLKAGLRDMKSKTIVRCYAKTRQAQDELWWRFEWDGFKAVDGAPVQEETESEGEEEDE